MIYPKLRATLIACLAQPTKKCGAVKQVEPPTLCSRFSQVRGAFAGALKDRPRKLELAHGSTLFIDEVADIPVELQGHLLDALQNREVVRLDDGRTRSLDLRVIASTT